MFNDLENLLQEHSEMTEKKELNRFNEMKNGVHDSKQLKADKSATLFDFIKMVDKIITLTMSDMNVIFIPDEGKSVYLSSDQKLDSPMITYKIIERKAKGELKPRIRENFRETDPDGNVRIGEIYGQKFKCHLQFNIFASVYTTAEQVMEMFEEAMMTYAGYFKKNGVAEILFDKQLTDESFDMARQSLSIRNLRYYVEIEKLTVIMRESIREINSY